MTAFYNEIEPFAAHLLRTLIDEGVIAPGVVSEKSIKELTADDVRGFTQVHLFAGGGLWSVAARQAGWADDRPLWTASCPCQPFSQAGERKGFNDERDLWPDLYRLIRECRPPVVIGEQVAAAAGRASPERVEQLKAMSRVRDRQALVDVLSGLGHQEWAFSAMSGLSFSEGPGSTGGSGETSQLDIFGKSVSQENAQHEAGFSSCERSKIASSGKGDGVRARPVPRRDTGPSGCRDLRDDGHPVHADDGRGAHMGQPVNRQDQSETRLFDKQHTDSAVRAERDDGRVGRRAPGRGGGCVEGAAEGRKAPDDGIVGAEPDGSAQRDWLDRTLDDLEAENYASGAMSFAASSVDAPHIRQRLYWVALADGSSESRQQIARGASGDEATHGRARWVGQQPDGDNRHSGDDESAMADAGRIARRPGPGDTHDGAFDANLYGAGSMAEPAGDGRGERRAQPEIRGGRATLAGTDASGVTLGDAILPRLEGQRRNGDGAGGRPVEARSASPPDGRNGSPWADAEWLICHDGKARRTKPGLRLLVDGLPRRVDLWRVAGNAIVVAAAAEVLGAIKDVLDA